MNNDYYHEPSDLELLSTACPLLRRVCVNHSGTVRASRTFVGPVFNVPHVKTCLSRFEQLSEVVLVGGAFGADTAEILSAVPWLLGLEMVHVEGLGAEAAAIIARVAPQLKHLGTDN